MRCYKEGSRSEWMRTWFSDKILIAESVQRKWPKTKGQILPGALFLPWVQEELLFSKDICKPSDKISARTPGAMPGREPQRTLAWPQVTGGGQQGGQEPDQLFCSRLGLALSPGGGMLLYSKGQVWDGTW